MQSMWMVAMMALLAQAPAGSLGDIEKLIAAGEYQRALTALAGQPESFAKRLLASKAYDGAGDAAQAVAEAEAALAQDPRAEAGHLQLGQIFLGQNTPQAALEIFTEGLGLHPRSVLLRAGRGLALKDLALYDEAEAELAGCLTQRPGFSICFDGLATVYLHTKRFAEMRRIAAEHRRRAPRDYRGPYFAAVAGNALGDAAAEAMADVEAALTLQPNFAAARALRGRLLLEAGDVKGATESLEMAVRLRPDYPPALLNLAQAYKRAGREAEAEKTYELLRQTNERERQGKRQLIYHRGQPAGPGN